MEYNAEYFINEIYELEAGGILADLALSPSLFSYFLGFDDTDRECYNVHKIYFS